jgi:hypothetical protein
MRLLGIVLCYFQRSSAVEYGGYSGLIGHNNDGQWGSWNTAQVCTRCCACTILLAMFTFHLLYLRLLA